MSTTPPDAPLAAPPPTPGPTPDGGLDQNIAGGLAYVTIIPAIIFLAMAPYNRNAFIRFHSFQSLFLFVAAFIAHVVLHFIPIIGWMMSGLLSIVVLIFWLIAMLKAFQGQEWKIPVIGDLAKQQTAKGAL